MLKLYKKSTLISKVLTFIIVFYALVPHFHGETKEHYHLFNDNGHNYYKVHLESDLNEDSLPKNDDAFCSLHQFSSNVLRTKLINIGSFYTNLALFFVENNTNNHSLYPQKNKYFARNKILIKLVLLESKQNRAPPVTFI